jgi:hypothetical protein
VVERWHGIKKLIEETGELLQELGKLEAYPTGKHPDENYRGSLLSRIENELGDVYAALDYFQANFDMEAVRKRRMFKGILFRRWQLSGISVPDGPPEQPCPALMWTAGRLYPCGRRMPCPDHVDGCQGAECPRDGECPVHGVDRPGQCIAVPVEASEPPA